MALFMGIKIEGNEDYEKLVKALNEIGIKMPDKREEDDKSFVYAMGAKSKYLVDIEEFSDEEIQDEYLRREI